MSSDHQCGPAQALPPQNLDAECAVLGAMILNPGAVPVARDLVTSGDFYRLSHGTVFAVVLEMDARGDSVDTITLAAELRRQGLLDQVGGLDFIYALPDLCPVAVSVAKYAVIVREMARRRDGIELSRRLEEAFAEGTPSEQATEGRELLRLLGISSSDCACHDGVAGPHGVCGSPGASPIALEGPATRSLAS